MTTYAISKDLVEQDRTSQAIPLLLDILSVDMGWEEKKAYLKLMEIFEKLGDANEAVIDGKSRLAKITQD